MGERPEGRGLKASEAGTAPGGRRTEARGGGRGRQPGSPTSARRSVRPGLRAPSSQRGGRGVGGGGQGAGRGRGGAGERGGGSDPRLQPAPETRRGPRDPQEVCNDTSYDAHRARGCRCPGEMWTYPPTTHTRAGASSPHPDRCGTHDLWYVLRWAAPSPASRLGPAVLAAPWSLIQLRLNTKSRPPYKTLLRDRCVAPVLMH